MPNTDRVIMDGKSSLRFRGVRYMPGQEDELEMALTPEDLTDLRDRKKMISGDGWTARNADAPGYIPPASLDARTARQMRTRGEV